MSQLVLARKDESPLRVLRDADLVKLHNFKVSNTMRSLERVSTLVDPDEVRKLVRETVSHIQSALSGNGDWVSTLDVQCRLLSIAASCDAWTEAKPLIRWMDTKWRSIARLRKSGGLLKYRDQEVISDRSALVSMRNYLHERKVQALTGALRPRSWRRFEQTFRSGLAYREGHIRFSDLLKRARRLSDADLRIRDREDDRFEARRAPRQEEKWQSAGLQRFARRFRRIEQFTKRCRELNETSWVLPPAQLFALTRPPSYFDVSRRWLNQAGSSGFEFDAFDELLQVVNAIRGTEYQDPVGSVTKGNGFEVRIPPVAELLGENLEPRVILGDLALKEVYWKGAATWTSDSETGTPVLSRERLDGLVEVLSRASKIAKRKDERGRRCANLLVLPELAVPRDWFRSLARHVVETGEFGLITGLEYLHDKNNRHVRNEVVAIFSGPQRSAATIRWTKQKPAREERRALFEQKQALAFPPLPFERRLVVKSVYGLISVLICSEVLEAKQIADLLGRVEVLLMPSWNKDTAAYDHAIQTAGTVLHCFVAIANNGVYSDSRAWAPLAVRWRRDLCRLIERGSDSVVWVDLPLASLRSFHSDPLSTPLRGSDKDEPPSKWRPLPPEWPQEG